VSTVITPSRTGLYTVPELGLVTVFPLDPNSCVSNVVKLPRI
jgi:hypothetical protein